MTQAQFMYELMIAAKELPDDERLTLMSDYDKYFELHQQDNAADALPSPKEIAESYLHGEPIIPEGVGSSQAAYAKKEKATALGVLVFILLIPVCAVYELLIIAAGLVVSVLALAMCAAAAIASTVCFGAASLSIGVVFVGIGGLFITAALVLLSAALFRLIGTAFLFFPGLMSRVLRLKKKGGASS